MRHAGTQELETDRLFLRRLLPEDADMMLSLIHISEPTRH